MPTDAYFATLSGTALAAELARRVDRYQEHVLQVGLFALWAKSRENYYGMAEGGFSAHEMRRKGDQEELVALALNHYRNLLTHYLTLAVGQRASLDPVASTNDYEAEIETGRARGIIDSYMRRMLEQRMLDATEYGAVCGTGWLAQEWDAHLGEPVIPDLEEQPPAPALPAGDVDAPLAPPSGEMGVVDAPPAQAAPLRTGDLSARSFLPTDAAIDPEWRDGEVPWLTLRYWVNRHDLIAKYPEHAEKILGAKRGKRERELDFGASEFHEPAPEQSNGDVIALYRFLHEKTPACPEGKEAFFLSEEVLLLEAPLAYSEGIPARRVDPARIIGTPFGYSPAWDLLAPQEALNVLASIALTNQQAHGVGVVVTPKGGDISPQQVGRGLALIEYNPGLGKPEALNFTNTPAEVFGNQDRLVGHMETISGINSVVRGNPEASLKSGSALALVQAQAVQFSSLFQGSIVRFQEKVGTDTITIFRDHATVELKLEVTGLDGVTTLQAFSGESVKSVRRVKVDAGNPLSKTLAGRSQLAENLVKNGFVKDGPQYLRVIETGRLEPLTEHESRERSNIKAENEMLARARFVKGPDGEDALEPIPGAPPDPLTGQPKMRKVLDVKTLPRAMASDNHLLHAQQHLVVLASPGARANDAVVQAVLDHVEKGHLALWQQLTLSNPALLEMLGIPPCQAALQQQMMLAQAQQAALPGNAAGAQEGAPTTPPGGAPSSPSPSADGNDGPPGPQGQPNMPQMPKNPVNGVRPEAPGPGGSPI